MMRAHHPPGPAGGTCILKRGSLWVPLLCPGVHLLERRGVLLRRVFGQVEEGGRGMIPVRSTAGPHVELWSIRLTTAGTPGHQRPQSLTIMRVGCAGCPCPFITPHNVPNDCLQTRKLQQRYQLAEDEPGSPAPQ